MTQTRPDEQYIRFDPFAGDRDGPTVRNRRVAVVITRTSHWCAGNGANDGHTIVKGTRARFETAVVDNEWQSYWYCTRCIDKWFDEIGE